jgi:hypothetical protein
VKAITLRVVTRIVGSIVEELDGTCELIVTIEVLDHVPAHGPSGRSPALTRA